MSLIKIEISKFLTLPHEKFWETLAKFIHWICDKFDIAKEDSLIRDFQRENKTFIDLEKKIKKGGLF